MFNDKICELTNYCKEYLLTKNEFVNRIEEILSNEDSLIESFLFKIECKSPLNNFYIGNIDLENIAVNYKNEICTDINIPSISKFELSIKLKNGVKYSNYEIFEDLFRAYWRDKTQREAKTLLLPDTNGDMPKTLNNTIKEKLTHGKKCVVIYGDIDKFKNVNDTYNHETGDLVITKVAGIIEKETENSIPIHSHGDEFSILHFCENPEEILATLDKIRQEIKIIKVIHKGTSGNEEEIEPGVGLSFGIYILEENELDNLLNYSDYLKKAEEALVPDAETGKQRGKIRLFNKSQDVSESIDITKDIFMQILLRAKSNLLNSQVFNNIWLQFIHSYIQNVDNLDTNNFQEYFERVVNIVSPKFSNKTLINSNINTYTYSLSLVDILIAFLSGCQTNSNFERELRDLNIQYDLNNHILIVDCNSENIIKFYNEPGSLLNECETFNIPSLTKILNKKKVNGNISNSLLIKIGDNYSDDYNKIYNTVINVDNRPITGGGLPDFWEAALAHLIHNISSNQNIKQIFVLGDIEKKTKISSILKSINDNSKEDIINISYKIGYDSSTIDTIFEKLKNNIYFIEEENLIKELFKKEFDYNINKFDLKLIDYSKTKQRKGYLKKEVNLDKYKLDNLDGCKGESLQEIYPVVINNIREMTLQTNVDFSNKKFKELIDYKIILTKPQEDNLPWFYENDKESFEHYFKYNFLDEKGTFYHKLNANNQIEVVLSHLTQYIISSKVELYSTRRAVIILDNHINNNLLEPVGLISIRIYLNLNENNTINVNFTYIWRTVEVIVGLPYSLYGSIKYSEHLFNELIKKLKGIPDLTINVKNIQIGNLNYIAQSLHMFKDSYSEIIAKNIVDEATI